MKYAITLLATHSRFNPWTGSSVTKNFHEPAVVEANSVLEAEGIAMRICKKVYPSENGWNYHSAGVVDADRVVTIDDFNVAKTPNCPY